VFAFDTPDDDRDSSSLQRNMDRQLMRLDSVTVTLDFKAHEFKTSITRTNQEIIRPAVTNRRPTLRSEFVECGVFVLFHSGGDSIRLGIPVKVNANSGGKPNGIPERR
jgi:hypothetical protein